MLPSINVDIGFFDSGILNIKWNWALDSEGKVPSGKRTPVEVPAEILNTTRKDMSEAPETLDSYLTITDAPFRIDFN